MAVADEPDAIADGGALGNVELEAALLHVGDGLAAVLQALLCDALVAREFPEDKILVRISFILLDEQVIGCSDWVMIIVDNLCLDTVNTFKFCR